MSSMIDVVVIGAGQSGLAAAHALQARGIRPVVLEAGDRAAGSWPRYYDSLKAFSPARFNSMPGMPFPGDPDRYPARDEVADYLDKYAAALGVEIHTGTRVATVGKDDRGPTSWRRWQRSRLPRGTRSGSFRSGLAGRTCTTGWRRPGSTRCPPNGWTRSPEGA
jgi:cation diffusion facilitator CzcD-associated flavoprotein CzcO